MLRALRGEVIGPFASLDRATAVARAEALEIGLLDVNVGGRLVTPVADALAESRSCFARAMTRPACLSRTPRFRS
jgi:hypothetical protein